MVLAQSDWRVGSKMAWRESFDRLDWLGGPNGDRAVWADQRLWEAAGLGAPALDLEGQWPGVRGGCDQFCRCYKGTECLCQSEQDSSACGSFQNEQVCGIVCDYKQLFSDY